MKKIGEKVKKMLRQLSVQALCRCATAQRPCFSGQGSRCKQKPSLCYSWNSLKITQALWPPKPSEFDMAMRTLFRSA